MKDWWTVLTNLTLWRRSWNRLQIDVNIRTPAMSNCPRSRILAPQMLLPSMTCFFVPRNFWTKWRIVIFFCTNCIISHQAFSLPQISHHIWRVCIRSFNVQNLMKWSWFVLFENFVKLLTLLLYIKISNTTSFPVNYFLKRVQTCERLLFHGVIFVDRGVTSIVRALLKIYIFKFSSFIWRRYSTKAQYPKSLHCKD